MIKPELLAPAGNLEGMKVAVEHGADAVYFGAQRFSARAHAENFTFNDIKEGIDFCHGRGVKAYCAVNTLLFNNEMADAIDTVYELARVGTDGFIVQDIGLASILQQHLPMIPLHGSTQMTVHNVDGAKALEQAGFNRVVLSRECSLSEISTIAEQTNIELEIFVHGALCISYSGACLMSSFCGGRSGNRGDCAQPCRKSYRLKTEDGSIIKNGYVMSPKDLNTYSKISDLLSLGITSLKIEGRMKKPEYIAAVTDAYRRQIDAYLKENIIPEDIQKDDQRKLSQAFNRGGFTTGYWYANQGSDLISIHSPKNQGRVIGEVIQYKAGDWTIKLSDRLQLGDGFVIRDDQHNDLAAGYLHKLFKDGRSVDFADAGDIVVFSERNTSANGQANHAMLYKTFDKSLAKEVLAKSDERREDHLPRLNFHLIAIPESPLQAIVSSSNSPESTRMESEYIVQYAQNNPTDMDKIMAQLSRLGDVPFVLGEVSIEGPENIFIPASILNQIRRDAAALTMSQTNTLDKDSFYTEVYDSLDRIPPQMKSCKRPNIAVHVGTLQQAEAAISAGADELIFNLTPLKQQHKWQNTTLNQLLQLTSHSNTRLSVTASNILFTNQLNDCMERFNYAAELGIEKCHAGNIGLLQRLLSENRFAVTAADYSMNVTNDISISTLMYAGVSEVLLSPELSGTQIRELSMIGNMPLGIIVGGDYPLMTTEYCAIGSWAGGRTANTLCSMPCIKTDFVLQTEDERSHPLATDENCRMMILGDRMMLLYEHIDELFDLSLDTWRIEGRFMTPQQLSILTAAFSEGRNRLLMDQKGVDQKDFHRLKKRFQRPFTDMHYKRGIRT